jgi:hypothetical protein
MLGAAAVLLVVACGSDTPQVPQAVATPLTESSVDFKQTGDAPAVIDQGSISYRLDDARLLQVGLSVRSTAAAAETVSIRASLYEKDGRLIGDATGGAINVGPGATVQIRLSGPHPNGTIASAVYEVHVVPAPTGT